MIPDHYRQAMQGILSMNNTMGVHGQNNNILFLSNGFEEVLLFDILEDGQLQKNEERMTLNHLKQIVHLYLRDSSEVPEAKNQLVVVDDCGE